MPNVNQLIANDPNIAPGFREVFADKREAAEIIADPNTCTIEQLQDQRMDILLSGNEFSALAWLQGAIRHLLRHGQPWDRYDWQAVFQIENAQSVVLSDYGKAERDRVFAMCAPPAEAQC